VVVTDQGGPSEVVDNGLTGFVLPADGPVALSRWRDTLVRLVTDRELRARMGAAGQAKIAPLSIRASFDHFWDVHRQTIEACHHAPAGTR
jgi:glycosyltransferase involved in cell wall biosynthesis